MFRTCFFGPFPSFDDEQQSASIGKQSATSITINKPHLYHNKPAGDNDNPQSHDQEESKLNSTINKGCPHTYR